MKRGLMLSLALGSLLGLSVISEGASDKPKRGGTLTMAIQKDLTLMNPLVGTRSTDQSIRDLMYESLLGLDLQGNIQPNLAESWEVSKDGRVYAFRLRRGVKFHNSQEMTAEDVKFVIDYTLDPKNGAYGFTHLRLVERVELIDKYAVSVHLKSPSPAFLSLLTSIQAFSLLPRESLKEGLGKLNRFPPGTGPFKFVEWKPGQQIVFERFDDYWGHKAFLDRVILRPIKDGAVRFTALRAGDVDMAERTPYESAKQVLEGKIKGIGIATARYAGFRGFEFNVAAPPFNDKKLRLAVAHALNKKEILQAAYVGFGEVTDQKYPKGHAWYAEGIPFPTRDLNKAKSLLKEAGYSGEMIRLMVHQGESEETEATMVQAQLKEIGMNIKLDLLESGTYSTRQRRGEYAFKPQGGDFDPDFWATYGPDLMCELDVKKRAENTTGYCDKEMDALLKRAQIELDAKKRRELLRQILTKISEDMPTIYVGFVPRFFTFRDTVKGFTTNDDAVFRWWGGGLNTTWLDK